MTIPEFIMWAISALIILLTTSYGWFITNTLSKIDKNQERMSELLSAHERDIAVLQTKHDILLEKWKEAI